MANLVYAGTEDGKVAQTFHALVNARHGLFMAGRGVLLDDSTLIFLAHLFDLGDLHATAIFRLSIGKTH